MVKEGDDNSGKEMGVGETWEEENGGDPSTNRNNGKSLPPPNLLPLRTFLSAAVNICIYFAVFAVIQATCSHPTCFFSLFFF